MQNPFLDSIQNAKMLHDLQILNFTLVQLIWVLAGLEGIDLCCWIHRSHLLGHLVGSWNMISKVAFCVDMESNVAKQHGKLRTNHCRFRE